MNTAPTVFAKIMYFLPLHDFRKCIRRYRGDYNVIEWLEAGAHVVTIVSDLLRGMWMHPYSKETVQMFPQDAAKAEKMLEGAKGQLA